MFRPFVDAKILPHWPLTFPARRKELLFWKQVAIDDVLLQQSSNCLMWKWRANGPNGWVPVHNSPTKTYGFPRFVTKRKAMILLGNPARSFMTICKVVAVPRLKNGKFVPGKKRISKQKYELIWKMFFLRWKWQTKISKNQNRLIIIFHLKHYPKMMSRSMCRQTH